MSPRGAPPSHPLAGQRIRLTALGCRPDGLRARVPGSPRTLLVEPQPGSPLPVEGEAFRLRIADSWTTGPRRWVAGAISEIRLDIAALGLEPLALVELGRWDPRRDQLSALPLGPPPRNEYELERIPPAGGGREGPEPALRRAIDLWAEGDLPAAEALLGDLLRRDLRCLAAHSCLGFFAFSAAPGRGGPARAQRHYEVGLGIAELSLPAGFDGALPWSRHGNRPFLRCLYGRSICLWRHGELDEARAGLLRQCRLNPGDQLAARLALDGIERAAR